MTPITITHDIIDSLIRFCHYDAINSICFDVMNYITILEKPTEDEKDFILSVLTATLPIKSKLTYRNALFQYATTIFTTEELKGL